LFNAATNIQPFSHSAIQSFSHSAVAVRHHNVHVYVHVSVHVQEPRTTSSGRDLQSPRWNRCRLDSFHQTFWFGDLMICISIFAICNLQSAICNMQSAISNLQTSIDARATN
jgi:hypothetical protein